MVAIKDTTILHLYNDANYDFSKRNYKIKVTVKLVLIRMSPKIYTMNLTN